MQLYTKLIVSKLSNVYELLVVLIIKTFSYHPNEFKFSEGNILFKSKPRVLSLNSDDDISEGLERAEVSVMFVIIYILYNGFKSYIFAVLPFLLCTNCEASHYT